MISRKLFLIFLSIWLPLHVAAGTLLGCDFVDPPSTQLSEISKLASPNVLPESAEHSHCNSENKGDSASPTLKKLSTVSTTSPNDCEVCKLHCATITLLNGIDEEIIFFQAKEKFSSSPTPQDDSIYLDLPHRPP
ncbi:MAG: hypothetical protein EOO68_29050, partial [Moraxellaceae bacterium]